MKVLNAVVLGLGLASWMLLTGCGSDDDPGPPASTPTTTATETAVPTAPATPAATQLPTATATPVEPPAATDTPTPDPPTQTATGTASATPTDTPEEVPTSTLTHTPTPEPCLVGPIDTTQGEVCGSAVEVGEANIWRFLGIPYAESTGGENRWAAPVPKEAWQGVVQATRFGPVCPQPNLPAGVPDASEDCLSINVWTGEGADASSNRPVMVFIYGGAYLTGASAFPVYDGAVLAARDVVVVTFNYRVGALGFLSGIDGLEGNYGFLDQQLALGWVRDNIASFGGDPSLVTIFGESAGAMSVGLHLLSAPDSADLFDAAIMESNPLALPYKDSAASAEIGQALAQLLDCSDDILACMRAKSFEDVVEKEVDSSLEQFLLIGGFEDLLLWAPIVDGTTIVNQPVQAARDQGLPKPLILGTNRDEGTLFVYTVLEKLGLTTLSEEEYEIFVATLFGQSNQNAILEHYPAVEGDNAATASTLLTDYMFFCSNRFAALGGGDGLFAYEFRQVSSFNFVPEIPQCAAEVCHTDELPYVFDSAASIMQTFTPDEQALSDAMVAYWTEFSRAGHSPNAAGTEVEWPDFASNLSYLVLDSPIGTEDDPAHNCDFWDEIGYLITPTPTPTPTATETDTATVTATPTEGTPPPTLEPTNGVTATPAEDTPTPTPTEDVEPTATPT